MPQPRTDELTQFEEKIRCGTATRADVDRLVELLWERYAERIFGFVFSRVGDFETATDLCQNTFVKALLSYRKQRDPSRIPRVNFEAWLFKIAFNEIRMWWRKRNPTVRLEDTPERDLREIEVPSPAETQVIREARKRKQLSLLEQCMEELTPVQRKVLVWRIVDNLSMEEIAHEVSRKVGAVRVMKHRALKQVRECIEQGQKALDSVKPNG